VSGDEEKDLVNSRDKRMFADPAGLKSARNTEPFLLHTYMRDTGEILSELTLPVFLDGRHWGACGWVLIPAACWRRLAGKQDQALNHQPA
jgi:methyl-accepting chemotaxis protein